MTEAIPFFAAAREYEDHRAQLLECADVVLCSGQPLQGGAVGAFETRLARRCERKHGVAVGSGTDALFFALRALDVGPGDEVLVPAFSFIASASCVLRVGARPVFVDIDEHYLLDLAHARRLLSPRTRALIVVDLFGQMGDPLALEEFACAHGLLLVEDAAQALGATAGSRVAGSVGTVSCCSFDPTKPLAAPGSGGALLCDDDELAARLRQLRWHGRDQQGSFETLGYNSQLSEIAAAMLELKLGWEQAWAARRRAIAASYDAALEQAEGLAPLRGAHGTHIFHKYVVRSGARDELRVRLAQQGIPTRVHYARPLHHEPCFATVADTPCAELTAREVLSLPMHAYLSDAEVEHIGAALTGV